MKRLVLLVGLLGFLAWRRSRLDAHDRTNGFGAFADVAPIADR